MIIADTGFFLALANRKDRHHHTAVGCLEVLTESLVTMWPVLAETTHLLVYRLGVNAQLNFLRSIRDGACEIFDIPPTDLTHVLALMRKYKNLPMDLADASLVLLAEHLGHGRIFSTDERDFRTYRWKCREPFENLLLR